MFAARRTAAFLRMLAEEMVPQNKIVELVRRLAEARSWNAESDDDFTHRELSMAGQIGPADDEIDVFCESRIAQHAEVARRAVASEKTVQAYWAADRAKVEGLERENRELRQALTHVGVLAPGEVT
jgi:hypothetical protein